MNGDLMDGMKRWHLMTDSGRKTVWAPSKEDAVKKARGVNVLSIHSSPDPLHCEVCNGNQ